MFLNFDLLIYRSVDIKVFKGVKQSRDIIIEQIRRVGLLCIAVNKSRLLWWCILDQHFLNLFGPVQDGEGIPE